MVEYARPETVAQVRQLAENLEQFDYAPGVQNVEEYGRYMIQKSGRFEYDEICVITTIMPDTDWSA